MAGAQARRRGVLAQTARNELPMERQPARLSNSEFDLLIIGGGISGACMAWDATLRGLSVALVEKGDFGEATSSASSKLIHGGIRYLQQGLLGKVRESIVERRNFLRIAPHLLHSVPFLIPTYGHGLRGRPVLTAGMALYGAIGADRNRGLPASRSLPGFEPLSAREVLEREPLVPAKGLTGGVVYPECQMHSSERMTLHFVASAAARGAEVANYLRVDDFLGDPGQVRGARATDLQSGERFDIRAKVVANVSGPWAFQLLDTLKGRNRARSMQHAKGCHLVANRLTNGHALALATHEANESLVNRGGRHIFIIPWRGQTLIGTTNVPFSGAPDDLSVTDADIDDFIAEVRSALPGSRFDRDQVRHTFAGLYPLVDCQVDERVYQGTGTYRIYDHQRTDGTDGLITVLGAKFTTARRLAERAVDLVYRKLQHTPPPCSTATTPVDGGELESVDAYVAQEATRSEVDTTTLRDLITDHGTRYREVLELAKDAPELLERVHPDRGTTWAGVHHAVRHEMTMTLSDLILRRTGLGTIGDPGTECVRACAALLAAERGWTADRTEQQIDEMTRALRSAR